MKKYLVSSLGGSLYSVPSNICLFDDELSAKIFCEIKNKGSRVLNYSYHFALIYRYEPIDCMESYDYTTKENKKIIKNFITEKENSIKNYQKSSNENKEKIESNALAIKAIEQEIVKFKELLA